MTLILGAFTNREAVLASDRRLTRNGTPYEDESNKALVLSCEDGRAGVAFTGLAELTPDGQVVPPGPPPPNYFATRWWLPDALVRAAGPDYELLSAIQRFCRLATEDFAKLCVQAPADKILTVVFGGFSFEDPPRGFGQIVSNFDGERVGDFAIGFWWQEKEPGGENRHATFAAGLRSAIPAEAMNALGDLARRQASTAAVVARSISLIREASDRSAGLIGKQCTSIVLPSDPRLPVVAQYHSDRVVEQIRSVSSVVARRDGQVVFLEPQLHVEGSGGAPEPLVPRVGRNKPCPCGSGKKYKGCHGAPK